MITLHDISIREGDMIAPCLEATNLSTSDKGTHSCVKFVMELKSGNAPANALLSSDLHSGSNRYAIIVVVERQLKLINKALTTLLTLLPRNTLL
jgi:hypothetical protein